MDRQSAPTERALVENEGSLKSLNIIGLAGRRTEFVGFSGFWRETGTQSLIMNWYHLSPRNCLMLTSSSRSFLDAQFDRQLRSRLLNPSAALPALVPGGLDGGLSDLCGIVTFNGRSCFMIDYCC